MAGYASSADFLWFVPECRGGRGGVPDGVWSCTPCTRAYGRPVPVA